MLKNALIAAVKDLRRHNPAVLVFNGVKVLGVSGEALLSLSNQDAAFRRETGGYRWVGIESDFQGLDRPQESDEVEVDGRVHYIESQTPRNPPGLVLLELQ